MELFNVSLLAVIFVLYNVCDGTETKRLQNHDEIAQMMVESMDQMPNDIVDAVCEFVCGTGEGSGPSSCCPETGFGPHDITCLRSWWIEAGCVSDSSFSPDSATENVIWWNQRTVEAVKADMALYPQYAASGIDGYYSKCYGTINPNECDDNDTEAPHSMACLISWWENAGCSLDGTDSPIHKSDVYWWQQRSESKVKEDMALFKQYADQDYLNYDTRCYGSD